jgi:hypothetical protein
MIRELNAKPITTCTLCRDAETVTIGWANLAHLDAFRAWLNARLTAGYRYEISEVFARAIIYNWATVTDNGVNPSEIRLAQAETGVLFSSGDVSIVRVSSRSSGRFAATVDEIIAHDTTELAP